MNGVEAPSFSAEESNEEDETIEFVEENGKQISIEEHIDKHFSKQIVEESLQSAFETQTPKNKRKTTIVSLILLFVNIAFMFFIVTKLINNMEEGLSVTTLLNEQGEKLWWLVGGLVIYCLYIFVQTLMYKALIKHLAGKKKFGLAYDVAVVGKYYDNVTPFAVGGQPMQIVRLANGEISPGVSTSIPVIKMIMNSTINMILALCFFVFGISKLPVMNQLNGLLMIIFEVLGAIGLIITVIVTLFMLIVSSGNFVTRSLMSSLVRFGYKLKLVKNYRQSLKKLINQVYEYKSSMSLLRKDKVLFFKMLGLCVLECLTYGSLPFFVVMAFSKTLSMGAFALLLICYVKYYICSMASSYIPLPGGTGLMEISFIFMFSFELGSNIVWALLAWRFLSYYLILIHGFSHELVKIFKNLAQSKKERKIE